MTLYDQIGQGYDATRRADPYIVQRLVLHLAPRRSGLYLDVGCGSGNYTIALADCGLRMVGLDPSATMIASARQKPSAVRWHLANAESLPFARGSFAGAVSINAHHHFANAQAAFDEIARVVVSGARLVLFHSTARQMRGYWLNAYFPAALERSVEQYMTLDVSAALDKAGFRMVCTEPYEVTNNLQDLFLYSGKYRPELYLDPVVRAGISTFAVQAEPHEIERGCDRLAQDIASGRIAEIIESYRHDAGDYLFTVAEK